MNGPFADHFWPEVEPQAPLELRSFAASTLAQKDVPARPWLVRDVVPGRQVTLLFGDGATGKSLLAMQLGVATATGRDWIGLTPEAGPAIYVGAEDDEDEIHRRLIDISSAKNLGLCDLNHFHIVPLAGLDAVLAEPESRGSERLKGTRVWAALVEKVKAIRPRLLVIDTLADAFAGNENSRPQARQFISLLRGLAIDYDLAVVILAHPSVSGMSQGSGTSGSTGWNNSARSRLYFERVVEDKVEPDPNRRVLTVKKVNYGRVGQDFRVRWVRGAFVIDGGGSGDDFRSTASASADAKFLELLALLTAQGRDVTDKPGKTYAPKFFAGLPNAGMITKHGFTSAMERLLAANKIKVVWFGPPSRQRSKLVVDCPTKAPTNA